MNTVVEQQLEIAYLNLEYQTGIDVYKLRSNQTPKEMFWAGLLYAGLNKNKEAIQTLTNALEHGYHPAIVVIASLHRQAEDLPSAWAALEGVDTTKLLPLEATIFHREYAECSWRSSRFNDATNHIEKALRISRLNLSVNHVMAASLCFTSSTIYSMIGQEEKAFEHASEGLVVANSRRRPFLLYRRIVSAINLERFETAHSDLAELEMCPSEFYSSPENLLYAKAKLAESQTLIESAKELYTLLLKSENADYKIHALIALDRLERRDELKPNKHRNYIQDALKLTELYPRLENLTRLAMLAVPSKSTETAPIAAKSLEAQGQKKEAVLAWLYAINAYIVQQNWTGAGLALSQAERLKTDTDYTLNLELAALPRVRLYLASLGHPWSIAYCQNPNVSDLEIIFAHNDSPPLNPAHPYHLWDYRALNQIDRIIALALNSRYAANNYRKGVSNHHLFYLRNHENRMFAFRLAVNKSQEVMEFELNNPQIVNQTEECITIAFTEKVIVFSCRDSYIGFHILDLTISEPLQIMVKDPITHLKYKFILHHSKSIVWDLIKLQTF